jgi:hypothetical protein
MTIAAVGKADGVEDIADAPLPRSPLAQTAFTWM